MSVHSAIRLAIGMVLAAVAGPLAAQDTPPAPAGVDSASIAAGRLLYQGRGGCVPCHGEQAEGTPDGPSLIAGPWMLVTAASPGCSTSRGTQDGELKAGMATLGRCVVRRCWTLPRCGGQRPTCFRSAGGSHNQSSVWRCGCRCKG